MPYKIIIMNTLMQYFSAWCGMWGQGLYQAFIYFNYEYLANVNASTLELMHFLEIKIYRVIEGSHDPIWFLEL